MQLCEGKFLQSKPKKIVSTDKENSDGSLAVGHQISLVKIDNC